MPQKKFIRSRSAEALGPSVPFRPFNAAAFALACAIVTTAQAQDKPAPATPGGATNQPTRLEEVVVQGRDDSLVGVADSAAQGTVGAAQLELRPPCAPGKFWRRCPD